MRDPSAAAAAQKLENWGCFYPTRCPKNLGIEKKTVTGVFSYFPRTIFNSEVVAVTQENPE